MSSKFEVGEIFDIVSTQSFTDECVDGIIEEYDLLSLAKELVASQMHPGVLRDPEWCQALVEISVDEALCDLDVHNYVSYTALRVLNNLRDQKDLPRYSLSEPEHDVIGAKNTLSTRIALKGRRGRRTNKSIIDVVHNLEAVVFASMTFYS